VDVKHFEDEPEGFAESQQVMHTFSNSACASLWATFRIEAKRDLLSPSKLCKLPVVQCAYHIGCE